VEVGHVRTLRSRVTAVALHDSPKASTLTAQRMSTREHDARLMGVDAAQSALRRKSRD